MTQPAEAHVTNDRWALLAVSGLLLLASALAYAHVFAPPWKAEQRRARELVEQRLGAERAARLPSGFRQTWIEALGRVDRCVICHVGIEEGADLAELPHPARSHPRPELLAAHPVERFGCTLCHGGQGWATEKAAAHGEAPFWDEPLLSAARAKAYGLTAAELLETRCNACHRRQAEVAGMPRLNAAKALFKAKKCTACHGLDGAGGTTAPDLTRLGDAPPDHLVFPATYAGPRTALGWHAEHIRMPGTMVEESAMKAYGFSKEDALSLALLVTSFRRLALPPAWIPGAR